MVVASIRGESDYKVVRGVPFVRLPYRPLSNQIFGEAMPLFERPSHIGHFPFRGPIRPA